MLKRVIGNIISLCVLIMLLVRCATISSPQGGPRDSLPPVLIGAGPAPYAVNYDGKKVILQFNEYIQLKEQSKNFFISPQANKKPNLTIKGKSLVIEFQEPLDSNTTYRLDFGNSITDNNEGNPLRDFSFVFSTGDVVDSLMIVGQTIDAYTRDTVIGSFLFFFDSKADSTFLDSTMYRSRAEAVFRADSSGLFVADILKDKFYRFYALGDENGDQRYQAGTDMIGFLDSAYNPTLLPEFEIGYDSTKRRWEILSPEIIFEMFVENPPKRQTLLESKRTDKYKMQIVFNAPDPIIDTLDFQGVNREWLTQVWNPTKDTLTVWISPETKEQADRFNKDITARIAYQRHDSVWQLQPFGQNITFTYTEPGKNTYKMNAEDSARMVAYREWKDAKEAKRLARLAKRGKLGSDSLRMARRAAADSVKREKAIADSLELLKGQKNPFSIKVNASTTFVPLDDLVFDFQYPLRKFDTDSIVLIRTPAETATKGRGAKTKEQKTEAVPFTVEQDSVVLTRWRLKTNWHSNDKYEIMIPAKAIENIAFQSNDTLKSNFTVSSPDAFGTVIFNVVDNDSLLAEAPRSYILQIIKKDSKKDAAPVREILVNSSEKSEKIRVEYIPEGNYRLRVIEDLNNNGRWDTGSLDERRQAEKVRVWKSPNGSPEIVSKQNWEVPIEIDVQELFTKR